MNRVVFRGVEPLSFQGKEAYNTLRTNIQFCGKDTKVISITSCLPGEGKSTAVFRIAQSMAGTGKRVLFIDADIRKSVIVSRYRATRVPNGLSEYLSDQCEIDDIICETNIENMYAVFTGPVAPNPSALLGNENMDKLIAFARKAFDYVLIDCPPLGAVIDAAIVAQKCDGAILLIGNEMVSYKLADRVKKQLEQAQVKILGAILNRVTVQTKNHYGGYYGNYYGKAEEAASGSKQKEKRNP